ncbi:MAG TPA: glycosyltransferase family 4 protein [Candidatus Paceibacterota bacterium]
MNLLILTQKVDKNDDLLGFFHGWLLKFARQYGHVIVICLQKGEYNLPHNVEVLSLGKEEGLSQVRYILNFFKYIIQKHSQYDSVFVHMNEEYILLGGIFWRIMKKRILFWRNHPKGTIFTNIAVFLSHRVFFTSPYSYTAQWKKKGIRMPAGIDTEKFKRIKNIERNRSSVLSLGRISPVKNTEIIINAFSFLQQRKVFFKGLVYGEATTRDENYYKKVMDQGALLKEEVTFFPSVRNSETPQIYNQNEIFINATTTGSFDKTILEAMACETLVLVSNKSFVDVLPPFFLFEEGSARDLADKIQTAFSLSDAEKKHLGKEFRSYVVSNHSIDMVIKEIVKMS